jgi:hypothetical protein
MIEPMKSRAARKRLACLICIGILVLPFLDVFPVSASSTSWSKPRPSSDKDFDETIGNVYDDGIASLSMGVLIAEYIENSSALGDYVTLRVSISANTRKGIYYDWMQYSYNWYQVSNPTNITGDNTGNWLIIPWELGGPFLFYGVKYTSIWVCSNGFICLDSECTNATPSSIPSTNKPNTIIAPFWRDLDPSAGGSITYGLIYGTPNLFVISWNNVRNKANGVPQTFQLVIRGRVGGSNEFQNALLFQYKSITKNQTTTVGVEDQTGSRGTSVDPNSYGNNYSLLFQYSIMGCRLESLKIRLTKVETCSTIMPQLTNTDIGGYNVELNNSANPCGEVFGDAIGFAADLLLLDEVGIIFDTLLIIPTLSNYFSSQLSRPNFQYDWANTNENEAFVSAACVEESNPFAMPFDATLADNFIWKLTDNNNRNHLLTVTAESTYKSIDNLSTHTISTSVTLYMYAVTPSTPEGSTHGFTGSTYNYSTSITDPEEDPVRYEFNWSDGTEDTITDWYFSGVNVTASHSWASPGTYQVRARAQDIYELWSGVWGGWSPPLNVTINAPSVTISPPSASIYLGYSRTFTATVSDDKPPYSYQWYLNGSAVSGATSASWTFTPSSIGDYTVYVTVTDSVGTHVTSNTAPVRVVYYWPQGCVLANTRILMANGKTKPVQSVKPGDAITGYDVQSGTFVVENVTSNNCTVVNEILSINYGLLCVTPTDQPIYTDHGWVVNPQDLVIGWRIYYPVHNSWITIQSLKTLNGYYLVYDLRATNPDTFIGNGILLDRKIL